MPYYRFKQFLRSKYFKPAAAALLIAAVLIAGIAIRRTRMNAAYNALADMALDGDSRFSDALTDFRRDYGKDRDYKDLDELINLHEAHVTYELGNLDSALSWVSITHLRYLTPEQKERYDRFVEELNRDYPAYQAEKERKAALKEAAEQREFEARMERGGAFYVGMPERFIDQTKYGRHTRMEYADLKPHSPLVTKYYFDIPGSTAYMLVQCSGGQVISSEWKTGYKPYSGGSSGKKDDDPYDAKDYWDAEDFYYDYYDDFFDYEEAEDYFNEHH